MTDTTKQTKKVQGGNNSTQELENLRSQISVLRAQINALETQVKDTDHAYRLALADYQNLQKRTRKEQETFAKMSTGMLIQELLVPLDHLGMTADHIKDPALGMVIKQFNQVLEKEGLTEIEALNKPFNPITMEAIGVIEGEKDIVMRVQQKGYMLNGTLLRPAKVEVGQGFKS